MNFNEINKSIGIKVIFLVRILLFEWFIENIFVMSFRDFYLSILYSVIFVNCFYY